MEKKPFHALSEESEDILSEIGNIGIGNAATAMSLMLNSRLKIDFTHVYTLDFDAIMNLLGGPESLTVAVLSLFEGDAEGMLLFVLEKEQADHIINLLLKTEGDISQYNHMQVSAMKETGNILGGSYLSALEAFTGMHLRLLPPQICVDMAAAILSVPVIEFGQTGNKAFLLESSFEDEELDIKGHLLMVSSAASYEKMCSVLKLKV